MSNVYVTIVLVAVICLSLVGCGNKPSEADVAKELMTQKVDANVEEFRGRWNAAQTRVGKQDGVDYTWHKAQFPHPTYNKGTGEDYLAYAKLLIAMFENDEDFNFVTAKGLWDADLVHVTDGQRAGEPKKTPDGRTEIPAFTYRTFKLRTIVHETAAKDSYGLTPEVRAWMKALDARVADTRGPMWGAFDKPKN